MDDDEISMKSTYYEILGVSPNAEDLVIRAAYRALAQHYHPDKTDEPQEQAALRMAAITEAYQILSDPKSRNQYNSSLSSVNFVAPNLNSASKQSIASIEAQAWEILLRLHPELGSNLSKLESKQMYLAKTYRSLLLELISEKLVASLVQSVCCEMKEIHLESRLN